MAFPSANIGDRNGGNSAADTTSHTFNLPGNIVSGNLLLIFATFDSFDPDAGTITWPSGGDAWTQVYSLTGGGGHVSQLYKRTADGGEGSTISVTTGNSTGSSHTSYRVTGTTNAIEVATDNTAPNNDSPNPPSLTPTWGADDTLWFVAAQYGNGTRFVTTYPTSFTNGRNDRWDNGSGTGQGTGIRLNNTATENPGVFTLNSGDVWHAATVAVEPVNVIITADLADLSGIVDQVVSTVTLFKHVRKLADLGPDTGSDTSLDTVRTYQMSEKLRP